MHLILELLGELIGSMIMLPIMFIVCTPWILIRNIFRKGNYPENVKTSYKKVINVWKKGM